MVKTLRSLKCVACWCTAVWRRHELVRSNSINIVDVVSTISVTMFDFDVLTGACPGTIYCLAPSSFLA